MRSLVSSAIHLLLFASLLFFQFPCKAEDPKIVDCYDSQNYTSGSQFETNLKHLFTSLYTKAPLIGFNMTVSGKDPDQVYGLVQCRGDSTDDKCRRCVNTSSIEIVRRCPNRKEGVIRFGDCVLRYSDWNFFSQADSTVRMYLYPLENVSDPVVFSHQVGDLMDNLSTAAASSPSKFATGVTSDGYFGKIYGLLQCTSDLSETICYSCLRGIIRHIPRCCEGRSGGNVLSVSCNLRYDSYYFFESLRPPPPPPPPPALVEATPPYPPTRGGNKNTSRTTIFVAISVVGGIVLAAAICTCFLWKKAPRKKDDSENTVSVDSLIIDLSTLKTATGNFSDANKLGQGGFGPVYKGKLRDGCEIAVKRLSKNSTQGLEELKTEVALVAKLQHKNLVRLMGSCLEEQEKLLVYDYLPNSSLDRFLFDPIRRKSLGWEKWYEIIGGIAGGLLYLHQDSQLRIIHRDLKASNILLDEHMNPKISDFGLARLCMGGQTQDYTNRIAGTFGYMAPEYAIHGRFSTKSDVYSFGVLVLEIVTGQKNSSFHQSDHANIQSFVWQHWTSGTAFELLDETVKQPCSRGEVLRCIQIGLLCVQEDATNRPTMSAVVLMLSSYSVTLPAPSKPAFCLRSTSESTELSRNSDASMCHKSTTISRIQSINNVTITELESR